MKFRKIALGSVVGTMSCLAFPHTQGGRHLRYSTVICSQCHACVRDMFEQAGCVPDSRGILQVVLSLIVLGEANAFSFLSPSGPSSRKPVQASALKYCSSANLELSSISLYFPYALLQLHAVM